MSRRDQRHEPKEPHLLTQRSEANSEEKLKASLAYRAQAGDPQPVAAENLGTAEHRPRMGLIYDAPLGLKF